MEDKEFQRDLMAHAEDMKAASDKWEAEQKQLQAEDVRGVALVAAAAFFGGYDHASMQNVIDTAREWEAYIRNG